jgi:tripartite-type tricarboxylate transporter receptor subunit TctC
LGPNAINHAVYAKLPYDSSRDFLPVILTTKVPLVLVTAANAPIKDLKDLIEQARGKSSPVAYGSAGIGAGSHMAGELLASMVGVKFLHVPYKGDSPALSDLMGGQIVFALPTALAATPHIKSGRVKALAVTSESRLPSLPDVPTVNESLGLREYSAVSWGGFMVPVGTPQAVVDKLNADIGRVLQSNEIKTKLQEQGAIVVGGTSDEFGGFLKNELTKWKRVAGAAKIRLD